jgi:hypothetical protein
VTPRRFPENSEFNREFSNIFADLLSFWGRMRPFAPQYQNVMKDSLFGAEQGIFRAEQGILGAGTGSPVGADFVLRAVMGFLWSHKVAWERWNSGAFFQTGHAVEGQILGIIGLFWPVVKKFLVLRASLDSLAFRSRLKIALCRSA